MEGDHSRYEAGDVTSEQMKVHGKGLYLNRRLLSFVKPMLLGLALVAVLFGFLVFMEPREVRPLPQQSSESSSIAPTMRNPRFEAVAAAVVE